MNSSVQYTESHYAKGRLLGNSNHYYFMSKTLEALLTHLSWPYKTEPENLALNLQDFLPLKQEHTRHKVVLGICTEKKKQNSFLKKLKIQFCTLVDDKLIKKNSNCGE